MRIFINGQLEKINGTPTVKSILEARSLAETSGLAIAVNEEVVSRQAWEQTILRENDKVLIIQASQGG